MLLLAYFEEVPRHEPTVQRTIALRQWQLGTVANLLAEAEG